MDTAMQWDYLTLEVKPSFAGGQDVGKIQIHLDEKGRAGWELVSTTHTPATLLLFFKRPIRPLRESDKDA